MKIRSTLLLAALAGGTSMAAEPVATVPVALAPLSAAAAVPMGPMCGTSCSHTTAAEATARINGIGLIAAQTFWSLPADHRAQVAEGLKERGIAIPMLEESHPIDARLGERATPLTADELDAAYDRVADYLAREVFEAFTPVQQRLLSNFAELAAEPGRVPVLPCFTPGTNPDYVQAFDAIVTAQVQDQAAAAGRFEQTGRWGATASDPGGGGQGNPTILTYSFPVDGITIPSGVGEGSGPNQLNAFMDGIYGNRATWRAIYDNIFALWGDVSGNTYVLETNDDNVNFDFSGFDSAPGQLGVRGDLRMGGKFIDGNSGTLAYNFFPPNGDMVIDTGDNFYNNTSSNSLRLRNILLHEHGHGMGQLHTCPITQSKLMEPFISLAFDGPQFDDILNAQRHYGDPNEPNNSSVSSTDLGSFGLNSGTTVDLVSLDDDTDVDFYRFVVNQPSEVTVTLRPQGGLYQAGPQTQSCNESQPYNPLLFLDPAIQVRAANGSTVLASADNGGLGEDETIALTLDTGTYFIRASASNPSGDQIIAYELDLDVDFDSLSISTSGTIAQSVAPGDSLVVDIVVSPDGEQLVGTPSALYRANSSDPFTSFDLVNQGGDIWRATFPVTDCGEEPEFRFLASGSVSGPQFFPSSGNFAVPVVSGSSELIDNAETDIGWTVSGNATEGQWERGVPQNNGRDDPPADFDGSGQAWLTGQEANDDNSDVDGGSTILTSPTFDYSFGGTISYAYWAQDTVNPIAGSDGFFVEFDVNGSNQWTRIRSYATAGNWRTDTIDVTSEIGLPSALRIRFIATDNDPGNVLECGVDALNFTTNECVSVPDDSCNAADIVAPFGVLDLSDIDAFVVGFSAGDSDADIAAPFGVLDLSDIDAFINAFSAGCP